MCNLREHVLNFSQEEQFADEFLKRDGLNELISVIRISHGNMLAVRVVVIFLTLSNLIVDSTSTL